MDEIKISICDIQLEPLTKIQKKIEQPYKYLDSIPSNNKRIRSKFLNAFNDEIFQIKNKKILEYIDEIISILHNSSLLIDDIEDSSEFRRGFPAAHKKFGIPLTLNCGNLYYFKAYTIVDKLCKDLIDFSHIWRSSPLLGPTNPELELHKNQVINLKLYQILTEEMQRLHEGQGMDIYWRDFLPKLDNLPTLEDYLKMINFKTSGLFRLTCNLMKILSTKIESPQLIYWIEKMANLCGIIYQIRDDYLNLIDSNYSIMKGVAGEDLIEGKLSFPILIHLLNEKSKQNDQNDQMTVVQEILYKYRSPKERLEQKELIQSAIELLNDDGSLLKTRQYLKNLQMQFEDVLRNVYTHIYKDDMNLVSEKFSQSDVLKIIKSLCDVPS
ncbi:BTS1 [Candida jiufengensis]|uniref:BTS1 n=1 Tax=Candida jiufengensis TaxID=497108 RepID=UPI00222521CA|nr:BTS1 [Candida jiufengensis]KAI5956384.1 BTS1 [Candida jiufengensis]